MKRLVFPGYLYLPGVLALVGFCNHDPAKRCIVARFDVRGRGARHFAHPGNVVGNLLAQSGSALWRDG